MSVHTAKRRLAPADIKAFAKAHGDMRILEETYLGGLAQIKAMVETGTVTWDVLMIERSTRMGASRKVTPAAATNSASVASCSPNRLSSL